jgi:superfamily II DNA/RNA helicase
MENFRKLGIIEPILKSIKDQNFEKPSEIQEKSIPLIIEGRDVIAGASTGSGKTLAFASGIIKEAIKGEGVQALILTPTRELAEQVCDVMKLFSKNKHLRIITVYGGVAINPQIENLEEADVVVGTPGRILDHMYRETLKLNRLKILVLDEADRMLDMGFINDVEKIIQGCNKNRQTLLFSATISPEVSRLASKYMKNPVEVSAEAYVDPSKLKQVYYDVPDNLKFSLFVYLLKKEEGKLVMVFCNTQRNTDFVANNLRALGINALAIHGGYSQDKRSRTMEKFNAQEVSVLVCTDVAARGLDIKGISHIYNYDSPNDSKEYIHRIGRTARAGEEGKVINIIASRDYENFQKVIANKDLKIKLEETPEVERVFIKVTNESSDRDRRSGGNRFRSSGNSGSSGFRGRGGRSSGDRGGRSGGNRFSGNRSRDRDGRSGGNRPRSTGNNGFRSSGTSRFKGNRNNRFSRSNSRR